MKPPHGIQQYKGGGITKSCGVCGKHHLAVGGTLRPIVGWICKTCTEKRDTWQPRPSQK